VRLQIVAELNADAFSGGGDLRVHCLRPFPTAKLFTAIHFPVQALARHFRIELEWVPRARDLRLSGQLSECFFHPPLADVAPRANEVGINGNCIHRIILSLRFFFQNVVPEFHGNAAFARSSCIAAILLA